MLVVSQQLTLVGWTEGLTRSADDGNELSWQDGARHAVDDGFWVLESISAFASASGRHGHDLNVFERDLHLSLLLFLSKVLQ